MSFIPQSITPAQARLALNHFNLRENFETAIAAASQDVKDRWGFANSIEIDYPDLLALWDSENLTRSQLHELFIYGHQL